MRCHLYSRKGKVFIPTFGRVPGGPYRDIEPVAVVDVSNADDLRRAFRETIAKGNPPIGPYPRPNPPPVVVKYAGVKSWGAFARGALPWRPRRGPHQGARGGHDDELGLVLLTALSAASSCGRFARLQLSTL